MDVGVPEGSGSFGLKLIPTGAGELGISLLGAGRTESGGGELVAARSGQIGLVLKGTIGTAVQKISLLGAGWLDGGLHDPLVAAVGLSAPDGEKKKGEKQKEN